MIEQHLFIGYGSLEDWRQVIDVAEPVYADLITEPGKTGQYGMRLDNLVVMVSQPDDRNRVHYCRLVVARLQMMGEQPFSPDADQRRQYARMAWEIVRAWLEAQGLAVRLALVACPTGLRLLDGWADFLGYQKDRGYFLSESECANV